MDKTSFQQMTWSFSRLDSFSTCKLMWNYSYLTDIEKESNAWSDIGTFLHGIMEDVANKKVHDDEVLDIFDTEYDHVVPEFPRFKINLKKHYKKKCRPFFSSFNGFKHKVLGVELHFEYELPDGSLFQGYIDLITEGSNGDITVVDYKVSNPKNFAGKALEAKKRQLYMYAPAIKKAFGKYPERMMFSFFQGSYIIEEFDEVKLDETLKWAVETIEEIKKEESFEASPDKFFCDKICSFRSSCDKKL